MTEFLDYWKFVAGLGLFLYGMMRLEDSLKELAGKRFKLFLRKYTTNRFLAILNGAFAAAILQSSSIVLLMVIAFAGAGILSLSNSLSIILGANLGTTMTGWLVSTFGFSTKVESFVFPMIAIGSLGLIFVNRRIYIYHLFGFVIAIGLLLMGLGFMKEGMNHLASSVDVQELSKYGVWTFFLFGFLVTAVIQSSSAMMTITLSALYANVITLGTAAFIIIGADLGTTMTALLASFRGTAVKKRVGLAHFFFNVGTAAFALAAVAPLLEVIHHYLNITDPLFALVAFHSGFNAFGIILFFPLLGIFEKFLNRFFLASNDRACIFIHKVSTEIPEASIEAIRRELHNFERRVFQFNSQIVGLAVDEGKSQDVEGLLFLKNLLSEDDALRDYELIKKTEGELLEYFVALQKEKLEQEESAALNQYIMALRNGVQSAKSIKDIQHNLRDFRQSVIEVDERFTEEIHRDYFPVQNRIARLLENQKIQILFEELAGILSQNESAYRSVNEWVYRATRTAKDMGPQIATLLNVNREIYNSNRYLMEALEDTLLSTSESQNLSSVPKRA
ncbi:MAG: Na/Pi cotransporter family protein [Bdellovibrionales bacterium]